MDFIYGRLRATLVAGRIPVTDEALATLRAGLSTIAYRYRIEKAMKNAKTDIELKKELSRLNAACRTVVDVLDADLSGTGQIEATLVDPWRGSQIPRLVDELRSLLSRSEMALAMATQSGTAKRRQQDPETVFFLGAHDLFSELPATRNLELPAPYTGLPCIAQPWSTLALSFPNGRTHFKSA